MSNTGHRPTRVVCLIDSLQSGGAQRQLVELARLLQAEGYWVKVATYHPGEFYKPFLDGHGVENECIPRAASRLRRVFSVWRFLRRERPDWVIAYLDMPGMIACLLRPVCPTYRLLVSERNTTQRLTLRERLKFLLFRRADCIVPNSRAQERFIAQHYPNLVPKLHTITNLVDLNHFTPPSSAALSSRRRILVVGRVAEQKNVLRFLEAIALVRERQGACFVVDWYGQKYDYYRQCELRLAQLHLADIARFHDATPDIRHQYRLADVFCLPSIYEGFPNVICEAMACGLPILASEVCDNPYLVEEGDNGMLFDPLDVEGMAVTIANFLALPPAEVQRMRRRSRARAEELLGEERFIAQYRKLLQ